MKKPDNVTQFRKRPIKSSKWKRPNRVPFSIRASSIEAYISQFWVDFACNPFRVNHYVGNTQTRSLNIYGGNGYN